MIKITFEEAVSRTTGLLARSSAWLTKHYPYISDSLYGLVPEPVVSIQTMGVTPGFVLYYDPIWMISDKDLNGIDGYIYLATDLFHEVQHVLRDFSRIEGLIQKAVLKNLDKAQASDLANIAADIPINDDIDDIHNLKLHEWAHRSKTHDFPKNKTMEQYMDLLLRNLEKQQSGSSGAKKADKNKSKDGGGKMQCHACGGIAGNAKYEALEKELDKKFGRTTVDREYIKKATLDRIASHQQQFGIGSTPGFNIQDLAFKRDVPRINWEGEVASIIRRASGSIVAGGDDYSRARPSKRSLFMPFLRPSLIEQQLNIVFIRDTSGSVSDQELNRANNIIIDVIRRLGLDSVWVFDADVNARSAPKMVRVRDIPALPVKGRGGTSFIEPLEVASKLKPKPDLCIYLTDGFGAAPKTEPAGMKVIWCLIPHKTCMIPAPWGRVVLCSEKPEVHKAYAEAQQAPNP